MKKFKFILGYLDEMIKEDGVFDSEDGFKYLIKNISKKYTKYKDKKENKELLLLEGKKNGRETI